MYIRFTLETASGFTYARPCNYSQLQEPLDMSLNAAGYCVCVSSNGWEDNEVLCDLYRLPADAGVVQCGRLGWAGHVASTLDITDEELCGLRRLLGSDAVVKCGR